MDSQTLLSGHNTSRRYKHPTTHLEHKAVVLSHRCQEFGRLLPMRPQGTNQIMADELLRWKLPLVGERCSLHCPRYQLVVSWTEYETHGILSGLATVRLKAASWLDKERTSSIRAEIHGEVCLIAGCGLQSAVRLGGQVRSHQPQMSLVFVPPIREHSHVPPNLLEAVLLTSPPTNSTLSSHYSYYSLGRLGFAGPPLFRQG